MSISQNTFVYGNRTGAVAGLCLSILLASLGTSLANVALPTLETAFAAPFGQVQWVVLAYLLASTVVIAGIGRLGDLFGRRLLLLVGLALFSMASLLSSLAPSLPVLIAARLLQGFGAAAMMALAMAFVSETVEKEQIGSVMGLFGTMSAVGTALGPSLGGLLIAGFGWRAIFLAAAPFGLLAFLLVQRFLPAERPAAGGRFDLPGAALLAGTLTAYALAMTLGKSGPGPLNVALVIAAAAGAVIFVRQQRRTPFPLVRPAYVDGYGFWRFFLRIFLPVIAPGVGVAAVFCFMFSWVELLLAKTLTSVAAKPIAATMTRTVSISGYELGLLAAAGTLTIIPGALVIYFVRNYIAKGFALGRV